MALQWSGQQRDAIETAKCGRHMVIDGGPGGGKSTVSREIWSRLDPEMQYKTERLCFNKHTNEREKEILGDSKKFLTYNGLAWRIYARHYGLSYRTWKPQFGGRHRVFYELCARDYWPGANGMYEVEQLQALDDLKKIHGLVMATLFAPSKWSSAEEIDKLCERWGIDMTLAPFIYQSLPKLMKWTIAGLDEPFEGSYWRVLDGYEFTDLTYLIATTPSIRVETVPCLMPDEIQDATLADWIVLRRRLGGPAYTPGERGVEVPGQLIAAGDTLQSIYRFRGVYPDMYGRIVSATSAKVCPLTVSYRMGLDLLPRPKAFNPRLDCYSGNHRGEDREIDQGDVLHLVQPGHVFVFLTNAQAIRMAYWLIRNNIAAIVKGTEIGVDMKNFLNLIGKLKGFKFELLAKVLAEWEAGQIEFCKARYKADAAVQKIEMLQERCACLLYLWEGAWSEGIRTTADMVKRIEALFRDETDAHGKAAICMTIHKSKGLEYAVVYNDEADLKKQLVGRHPEEAKEHSRVLYVGLTRPIERRYVIRDSQIVRNANRL